MTGSCSSTPEYNHSFPASLKNAIGDLYAEWQHKPAGTVSYGINGGVRAVEALRLVLIEIGEVPIAAQIALSVFDDFTYADETDSASPFHVTAREYQIGAVQALVVQLVAYARALAPLRSEPTPSTWSRLACDRPIVRGARAPASGVRR